MGKCPKRVKRAKHISVASALKKRLSSTLHPSRSRKRRTRSSSNHSSSAAASSSFSRAALVVQQALRQLSATKANQSSPTHPPAVPAAPNKLLTKTQLSALSKLS